MPAIMPWNLYTKCSERGIGGMGAQIRPQGMDYGVPFGYKNSRQQKFTACFHIIILLVCQCTFALLFQVTDYCIYAAVQDQIRN